MTSIKTFRRFKGFCQTTPLLIAPLLPHRVVAVAAGYSFTVVATEKYAKLQDRASDCGLLRSPSHVATGTGVRCLRGASTRRASWASAIASTRSSRNS